MTTPEIGPGPIAEPSVRSVNVGLPRLVTWRGDQVSTAIYKEPVAGRTAVRRLNLDGDRQADLEVHGGPDKAVYAYPAGHYPFWRTQLADSDLTWGAFGENLTTTGLLEDTVYIGDRYRVGTAELTVTQPRTPCYKLAVRFGRADMVRLFHRSGHSGFYFAVVTAGDVAAGDSITLLQRAPESLSVAEINRLAAHDGYNGEGEQDRELLLRAVSLEPLAGHWRAFFRARLAHRRRR